MRTCPRGEASPRLERFKARWWAVAVWALLPLASTAAHAADTWLLMARHGECAPVSALKRTFPDLGTIAAPDAFVEFVRAKGLTVTSKVLPLPAGAAREVLVPQKELSLVFVTAEACGKMGSR